MAQKVQLLLTCDIDQSDDGVETVTFGFGGKTYALELCVKDRQEFLDLMTGYVSAARPDAAPATARRTRSSAAEPKHELQQMRAWAKANGYRVAERGRVPAEVRDAFHAAHG